MAGYGQFCSMARAHEVLGGRWTLLIVREILCGSRRFNDIRRGIPRVSRTMLSERLQELVGIGALTRIEGEHGPEYALTEAGRELASVVSAMGRWGQRWLPRQPEREDIDAEPVLLDMARRVRPEALPRDPFVIRFEIDRRPPRYVLMKPGEIGLCTHNPGFPESVCIRSTLAALVAWWRGDCSFNEARRRGLALDGQRSLVRAFPTWFERYLFAAVEPAAASASSS
jgi:DNA-binding HxlR family transcriptional regulator